MLQYHYMPDYLPEWLLKNDINSNGHLIVDKNYSGKWSVWHKNGKKFYETEYKDGKKNGKQIVWYESGAKKTEVEMKDDKENGKIIHWYESGGKKTEGEMKDGKANGKISMWYENGIKKVEGDYKDGRRLVIFTDMKDVKAKEKNLQTVIKKMAEPG